MSTTELLNRIERLPKEDYNVVVMLVDRLYAQSVGLKQLSEEDLIAELTQSIERSDAGFTKSAKKLSSEMRERYAVLY